MPTEKCTSHCSSMVLLLQTGTITEIHNWVKHWEQLTMGAKSHWYNYSATFIASLNAQETF